jgi:hypothetical protein
VNAFGIDFGGSRLRVALADVEGTWIIDHRRASMRMPIAPGVAGDGPAGVRFEINSLKRALDFDRAAGCRSHSAGVRCRGARLLSRAAAVGVA